METYSLYLQYYAVVQEYLDTPYFLRFYCLKKYLEDVKWTSANLATLLTNLDQIEELGIAGATPDQPSPKHQAWDVLCWAQHVFLNAMRTDDTIFTGLLRHFFSPPPQ